MLNLKKYWVGLAISLGAISGAFAVDESGEFSECCFDSSFWDRPIWTSCETCGPAYGEWLVELPPLFRPFAADPRQICYSAGWRFDDQVLVKNVIPVSFGDQVPLYRWFNVWPWGGDLQIGFEGALWACFDPLHDSAPLIDADYYGGIPITYAIDSWQFRLCGYHISTHIGDEFLLNHPHFQRKNPSAEFLDFAVSHDLTDDIRIYGLAGWVVACDDSFKVSPFYAALGTELRFHELGFYNECQHLYGTPIFAMHLRASKDFHRHIDMTYILGYEFGKTVGLERRMRIFAEYHDGYSVEGQFQRFPTNYFALRLTYGF